MKVQKILEDEPGLKNEIQKELLRFTNEHITEKLLIESIDC